MRPRFLILAVVGATLVVIATVAVTGAGGVTASAGERTLTFVLKASGDHKVDNPPKGFSSGDLFVGGDTVYDATGKQRVGRGVGFCLLADAKRFRGQCTDTLVLADGQITLQGAASFAGKQSERAITGGTGAYAGARGTATVLETGAHSSLGTLHLLP